MATTNTVNAGYVGALAGEIFVQAFKKSDTISKGCITILPNVIGSGFLPKVTYSDSLTAYACGWNPTGTVAYTDKEVVLKKYQIQNELCKDEFHATFQAQTQGLFGANNDIPSTIQDAILLTIVNSVGASVDTQIWQGNNTTNQFNGLLRQFTADTEVIDIIFTGATTKANVVDRIESIVDAIPVELEGETDIVLSVSYNVAKKYKAAQNSMGLNTTVGDKEMDYQGYRVEALGGLPNDTILAYRVLNVGFLTGLQNDVNSVLVSDDTERLDGNIRTKVVFTAGVGYSFGNQIVYGRI